MLLRLSSFPMALFVGFASHYVFNLEYDKYYKDAAILFCKSFCLN